VGLQIKDLTLGFSMERYHQMLGYQPLGKKLK